MLKMEITKDAKDPDRVQYLLAVVVATIIEVDAENTKNADNHARHLLAVTAAVTTAEDRRNIRRRRVVGVKRRTVTGRRIRKSRRQRNIAINRRISGGTNQTTHHLPLLLVGMMDQMYGGAQYQGRKSKCILTKLMMIWLEIKLARIC